MQRNAATIYSHEIMQCPMKFIIVLLFLTQANAKPIKHVIIVLLVNKFRRAHYKFRLIRIIILVYQLNF